MSHVTVSDVGETHSCDACIIGAGIVGVAIACQLASRGLSIIVVDPNQPGSGATAAGMGHVLVMDDSPVLLELTNYGRNLWSKLADSLPPAAEYSRPGTLWIAANQGEMHVAAQKAQRLANAGIKHSLLDSQQLRNAEPKLRQGLAGGLLVQDDAVVLASVVTNHLLNESKDRIKFIRGLRAVSIGFHTSQAVSTSPVPSTPVRITLDQGTRIETRYAINAAGTSAPDLTAGIPIRKRKGHLILSKPGALPCSHELVELGYLKSAHGADTESVAFNIQPRGMQQAQIQNSNGLVSGHPNGHSNGLSSGQILIGASRQYGSESLDVEPHMIAKLFERAEWFMPGISAISIERSWAGFRAATPDGLPLIGRYGHNATGIEHNKPHPPGVYLATGHEGLGITTSLATATLLADVLMGHVPQIDPAPYNPMRFHEGTHPD